MNIVNFTPQPALLGGLLIGLAAVVLLITTGRIFGISGIIGGLFKPSKGDVLWRLLVVVGLITGAYFTHLAANTPTKISSVPTHYLILGGLFVGFGTRLGSGCTSGHGVCGMSRLSVRSIVATITFMLAGVLSVYFFGS